MGQEDLRRDLKELREQVQALRDTLAQVAAPYGELRAYLEQLADLSRSYLRLLDVYARHGSVSPDLVVPSLKDDISRHIVSVLVEKGDRNISEITEAVKARRGTASRRIIRERLGELRAEGIVEASPGSRARTFRVSEEVLAKWSQVLGFAKYGDRPGKDSKQGDGQDA